MWTIEENSIFEKVEEMHVYRNIVTILLSNVRSLLKNTTDIVNDHRFMHNDILLFAEVQINLEQDVDDDDDE